MNRSSVKASHQASSSSVLESQVKDVISSAKSKIVELQREIEQLQQEYESVTAQVDAAHAKRREVVDQNKQLQDHLKQVKLQNEALAKRKVDLTQELKRAKEDLSSLIEKGEHQKSAFLKEIAAVKEQERKLGDQRDRERRAFEEQERANQRRI